MRLNYYFEYPRDITDVDNNDNVVYYSEVYLYHIVNHKLYHYLKEQHPDIEINPINSWNVGAGYGCCKYSSAFLIIENPDNKKYIAVSYCDKFKWINSGTGWDLENCVDMLTPIGIQNEDITYKPVENVKYTPCTMTTWFKSGYDAIEEIYKQNTPKSIPNKLYFRGGAYLFRKWLLENDNRFHIETEKILGNEFIKEMSKYSINIDINSVAEISCRTLDAIGLETALIRPKLNIQHHNPLIPDYHYAAVKCDDLSDYKLLADAYIERFEDLKKDPDLVHFLSTNGRKWYEENATIEANIKIFSQLINLNKLC
jgi:hypothetical protein